MRRRFWLGVLITGAVVAGLGYRATGFYGVNTLLRRGGSYWVNVSADDTRLPEPMRYALAHPDAEMEPGPITWQQAADGFEVGALPVLVDGVERERLLLTRFDPTKYLVMVRSAPAGTTGLDDWMQRPGVVFATNGSYYAQNGQPDTPLLADGHLHGPATYQADHGALVADADGAHLVDLRVQSWEDALAPPAHDGLVSWPLLLDAEGKSRVAQTSPWLANRNFVGQDRQGRLVFGVTTGAYFTLARFATFLAKTPLDLKLALNLDGGPVACQGLALGTVNRRLCGRFEWAEHDGKPQLLTWPINRPYALPVVILVRKGG